MNHTTLGSRSQATILGLLQLIRPKQWIKNSFVFAPLIFSGLFLNTDYILNVSVAALLFCIASSAVYIVNDLTDIEKDRLHPKKSKSRPLASGLVSIRNAVFLLGSLYSLLILSCFITPKVFLVIGAYLSLNIAYSFILKHQPVLDIFSIALGFVLRVYAGAAAINVSVSSWMFITTLCLALYLAAIKRRQELVQSGTSSREVLQHYSVSLVDRYAEMSATGALLFYSIFVTSSKPQLVVTLPFVLFGLFRYWYAVEILEVGESPTDALMGDYQLMAAILLWIGCCLWVMWPA